MDIKKKKKGKMDEVFVIDASFNDMIQASLKPMPKIKEKDEIRVIYNKHVPVATIDAFKKEMKALSISVKVEAEDEHAEHWNQIATWAVIYLGGKLADAILKKTIIEPVTDKFIAAVKSLWVRIRNKEQKLVTPIADKDFILCLVVGNLRINMPKELKDEEMLPCLTALCRYLASGQLDTLLGNMDYSEMKGWWQGNLNYDIKNRIWYAVHYGDFDKRMEETYKRMRETGMG